MGLTISNLTLENKNIIIVEDDVHTIRYYETLLRNTGANVLVLRSGLEFIEYIKQGKQEIDFIFMDYLIPFINGIDCVRIFRKTNKTTPVVMLTAYMSEQTKTEDTSPVSMILRAVIIIAKRNAIKPNLRILPT